MLKPSDFVANYSKTGALKSTAPALRLLLLGIAAGFILACAGAAASNALSAYSFLPWQSL